MGLSDDVAAFDHCLDPTLWIVTASDGTAIGGLLATFVKPASIVRELPRMVVGIARQHKTWELIESTGAFALHVLRAEHAAWATTFGLTSSRTTDKFASLRHLKGRTGSPILTESSGWLDCRVEDRLDTGDRTLYLAEILDARPPAAGPALTVNGWLQLLDDGRRERLRQQLTEDATIDAELIRAWRRRREDC